MEPLLSIRHAATLIDVCEPTIELAIRRGALPVEVVGGKRRVRLADLVAWEKSRRQRRGGRRP